MLRAVLVSVAVPTTKQASAANLRLGKLFNFNFQLLFRVSRYFRSGAWTSRELTVANRKSGVYGHRYLSDVPLTCIYCYSIGVIYD
jgi:hypothetical protein